MNPQPPPGNARQFCDRCGKPLAPGQSRCAYCGATLQPNAPPSALAPLQQSLGKLGIRVGQKQIVAAIAGIVAGLILARVLPYIYAPVVGSVLNAMNLETATRDSLNTFMMTTLTFLTSFLTGFIFSGRGRQKKG